LLLRQFLVFLHNLGISDFGVADPEVSSQQTLALLHHVEELVREGLARDHIAWHVGERLLHVSWNQLILLVIAIKQVVIHWHPVLFIQDRLFQRQDLLL